MVVLDFLGLVLAKMTGDLVSLRFCCSRWSAALVWACTSSLYTALGLKVPLLKRRDWLRSSQ